MSMCKSLLIISFLLLSFVATSCASASEPIDNAVSTQIASAIPTTPTLEPTQVPTKTPAPPRPTSIPTPTMTLTPLPTPTIGPLSDELLRHLDGREITTYHQLESSAWVAFFNDELVLVDLGEGWQAAQQHDGRAFVLSAEGIATKVFENGEWVDYVHPIDLMTFNWPSGGTQADKLAGWMGYASVDEMMSAIITPEVVEKMSDIDFAVLGTIDQTTGTVESGVLTPDGVTNELTREAVLQGLMLRPVRMSSGEFTDPSGSQVDGLAIPVVFRGQYGDALYFLFLSDTADYHLSNVMIARGGETVGDRFGRGAPLDDVGRPTQKDVMAWLENNFQPGTNDVIGVGVSQGYRTSRDAGWQPNAALITLLSELMGGESGNSENVDWWLLWQTLIVDESLVQ